MDIKLHHGDCLEVMKQIQSESVDMILCDLPYGTTACKWDVIIPLDKLWEQYERVIKPKAAIVLTASQPFTSVLISSNLSLFKYTWIWEKSRPGGFVNAKLKPLKAFEDICVFSKGKTSNGNTGNMNYYPQGLIKSDKLWKRPKKYNGSEGVNFSRPSHQTERVIEFENYPKSIIKCKNHNSNVLHPTEKPIELMEYLIKTYTKESETVLDNCMGSGSTGLACINTKRKFIGIEKKEDFFNNAKIRIYEHAGNGN